MELKLPYTVIKGNYVYFRKMDLKTKVLLFSKRLGSFDKPIEFKIIKDLFILFKVIYINCF